MAGDGSTAKDLTMAVKQSSTMGEGTFIKAGNLPESALKMPGKKPDIIKNGLFKSMDIFNDGSIEYKKNIIKLKKL